MIPVEADPGPGSLFRVLRCCTFLAGVCLLVLAGALHLTWPQQMVVGVVTLLVALWLDRASSSYLATLVLIFISVSATLRYGFWRLWTTAVFLHGSGGRRGWPQAVCVVALMLAEAYAAVMLLLGYLRTLWPLRRMPVPLPDNLNEWPAVDLLIPTFNEPLSIVRNTALAAMNIDWPVEKLNVYILDDGGREEFRQFAKEAGIGYIARQSREHAKAGNLNHALRQISSPFVAVFDCDHVPTRSFLQITLGWFLRDEKLGMLQTPQHLYSPDPFDRNLEQFRTIPNEGELFYGIVQDGNDFWNSTLFCGSCAVLRRLALDEIGGVAPETLTEDVHTSLRMQMDGWNTAYINIPQAAGLATESLDDHVRQGIRWARGMIQILRIDNPLFARGLSLAQRLCYFHAMAHFFYALPRLIFLLAPLAYLILGSTILPGSWAAVLAFALPHLLLSSLVNSRIQGEHRHSFWNDIYQTILAPYILIPTLIALIRPKAGRFEVTPKGGVVSKPFFDRRTAIPFLVMMIFQAVGLLSGAARLAPSSWRAVPILDWLHGGGNPGAVGLNMLWALFNLVILGVCSSVAWENPQRRGQVRLIMAVPVDVLFADGTLAKGLTADISTSGVALRIDDALQVRQGESVQLIFPMLDGEAALPATVIDTSSGVMRAQFDPLTLQEEEALTMVLYSRADTWLGWGDVREADRPWKSMVRILALALRGLRRTVAGTRGVIQPPDNTKMATSAVQAALLLSVFLGLTAAVAQFRSAKMQSARTVASSSNGTVATKQSESSSAVPAPQVPDLSLLPRPFLATGSDESASIPIVFLREPSPGAMKAAGIVASWFGVQAKERSLKFPVLFGSIPPGDAILIAEHPDDLPATLKIDEGPGARASIRTNPEDSSATLLVVSGSNETEVVQAATGLAIEAGRLKGDQAQFAPQEVPPAGDSQEAQADPAMPDLRLLARDGFPFTRKVDLSEATVVLPATPTPEPLEICLALLAGFGRQTGRPALGVTITGPEGLKTDGTSDVLLVDIADDRSAPDQTGIRSIGRSLPVDFGSEAIGVRDELGFFAPLWHAWWRIRDWRDVGRARLDTTAGLPDAMIEEAEWPAGSHRTAVVVELRNRGVADRFMTALSKSPQPEISRSVSVLRGDRFVSYRPSGEMYHESRRPGWGVARSAFVDFPWLLVIVNFAASFLLAFPVRDMLRRHARQRLLVSQ